MTQIDIVGIRSKSTSEEPTYFFSIESKDKEALQNTLDMIKQTLWVYGMEVNHIKKYHEGR